MRYLLLLAVLSGCARPCGPDLWKIRDRDAEEGFTYYYGVSCKWVL